MSDIAPHPSANRPAVPLPAIVHAIELRVRYGETDQMGTVYNSRPLDWFECGRTELLRSLGFPYADLEGKGLFLPLIEAHLEYLGRARYDDLLRVTTTLTFEGRIRLRCSVQVTHVANAKPVVNGYTVHVFTDREGKPIRPPGWLRAALERA
jgi:acyl-CoA thioester hydrolase